MVSLKIMILNKEGRN